MTQTRQHERRRVEALPRYSAMTRQRLLVVLKYVKKAPALASCVECRRKFFTPNTYYDDPYGAGEYLRAKFDLHDCLDEHTKTQEPPWSRPR